MTEILAGYCKEELKSFYQLAERFAKKELEPKALELDHYPYSEFNRQALEAGAEIGLFHLVMPEWLGGSGQGMAALSVILARLAQTDASFAAVVFIQTIAQAALVKWAKKEVAEKYIAGARLAAPDLGRASPAPTLLSEKYFGHFIKLKRNHFFLMHTILKRNRHYFNSTENCHMAPLLLMHHIHCADSIASG